MLSRPRKTGFTSLIHNIMTALKFGNSGISRLYYSDQLIGDVVQEYIARNAEGQVTDYAFPGRVRYDFLFFQQAFMPGFKLAMKDSDAVAMQYAFSLTSGISGADLLLPSATAIRALFEAANDIRTVRIDAPMATDAWALVSRCPQLEALEASLPAITTIDSLCVSNGSTVSNLRQAIVHCPKATNMNYAFRNCESLEDIQIDTAEIKTALYAFAYTSALTEPNLEFPALTSGLYMFLNSGLTAAAINSILDSLPVYTDGTNHTITFTGCPGAATCDPSIGSAKGWTVEI